MTKIVGEIRPEAASTNLGDGMAKRTMVIGQKGQNANQNSAVEPFP